MEEYFIIRGGKWEIDKYLSELSAKRLPWSYNGQKGAMQLIVNEIKLCSVAFPKEHRDIVLNTIYNQDPNMGRHQSDWKGQLGLKALRKALACKEVAPWNLNADVMPITRGFNCIMGIGEREDKINVHPATGIPNEGI